jgi:hypothetical protein
MPVKKPCTCGTCPACKGKKNSNMARKQSLMDRKKNSRGKAKSNGK